MTEPMTRSKALSEAVGILREAKAAIGNLRDDQVSRLLEVHDRWVTLARQLPLGETKGAQEATAAKLDEDELSVVRSFRMSEATSARLNAVAEARRMSASDLIREGVQVIIDPIFGDVDE